MEGFPSILFIVFEVVTMCFVSFLLAYWLILPFWVTERTLPHHKLVTTLPPSSDWWYIPVWILFFVDLSISKCVSDCLCIFSYMIAFIPSCLFPCLFLIVCESVCILLCIYLYLIICVSVCICLFLYLSIYEGLFIFSIWLFGGL